MKFYFTCGESELCQNKKVQNCMYFVQNCLKLSPVFLTSLKINGNSKNDHHFVKNI